MVVAVSRKVKILKLTKVWSIFRSTLIVLALTTSLPALAARPISITIFQDKSPAKQPTAPKSAPEFIDWWSVRALDYNLDTNDKSMNAAREFMDPALFKKFWDIFKNAKTKESFVSHVEFLPSAQSRYWSSKSGIKIKVSGVLIDLNKDTMPFQQLAILFDVSTTSGKPKITNFEVVDDKDGATANNFLRQAVEAIDTKAYTQNIKCLAQYKTGLKVAEAENYAQAKIEFDKAVSLNPKFALVYFDRSKILEKLAVTKIGQTYSINHSEPALDDLNMTIKLAPNYANAYYNRAVLRQFKEGPEAAKADLNQAIGLNPKFAEAYYMRFNTGNGGPIPTNFSDLDKAIELDPLYSEVYTSRGILKSYLLDLGGAVKDLSKAIEIDPEWTQLYCVRAAAKYQNKDEKGASEDLTKAIQADNKNCDAYLFRGYLKMQMGDNKGALADFSSSISAYDNFLFAYIARIEVRRKMGDTTKSDDYSKVQKIIAANSDSYKCDYATGIHMLPHDKEKSVIGKTEFPHKDFSPGISMYPGTRSERKHPSDYRAGR